MQTQDFEALLGDEFAPSPEPLWQQLHADVARFGEVDLWRLGVFLVVGIAIGLHLRLLYDRCVRSEVDAAPISRVFPLLILATAVIISVIKSSLALSLGLVGALSIVRFRAAIKEPEELVHLFICIGIGICLGAEQLALALGATLVVTLVVLVPRIFGARARRHSAVVTVTGAPERLTEAKDGALAVLSELAGPVVLQHFGVQDEDGQLRVLVGRLAPTEGATLMTRLRERLPECELAYVNVVDR